LARDVVVPVDEDRTVFSSEAWTIHKEWVQQKPEMYQPPTLQRVHAGERYSLEQIQPKRGDLEQFRSQIHELFHDVDVIVTPTSPILPPTFSELKNDPQSLRAKELLMLRNTRPWNVYGIPAISIPCGALMGIQLAALDEDVLIAAARVLG
jgi:Asp-tRNA(Asn)/Glu-tRNA(Gln) amidotransferase A subunit family amidase